MPRKKRERRDFAPHVSPDTAPVCSATGCGQAGLYRAPKSKDNLREYNWFCLEHIREHNSKWDYFAGMDSSEIESFMQDAVTGHRPTWNREERMRLAPDMLHEKLYEFMTGEKKRHDPAKSRLPAKTRRALAVMELEYPYTIAQLKAKYRYLVKKHHPDVNNGDKELEEKFKDVTTAYKYLLELVEN